MMLLIVYKVVLLVCVSTLGSGEEGYVSDVDTPAYYKYDAKPGQFPWAVHFKTVEHCMGALVHPSWVLTAAHCLEQSSDPSHYTLELGGGGRVERASELHPYPRYHSSLTAHVRDHGYDIALVKLARPFNEVPTLSMRHFPFASDKHRTRPCHVLGYVNNLEGGVGTLQYARAYARTFSECYRRSQGQGGVGLAMRHTICATGTGRRAAQACSGDPGGPLVCPAETVRWKNSTRKEAVGVASWNQPGVYCGATSRYTDVGYFRDWLKATISGDAFIVPRANETNVRGKEEEYYNCLAPRNYVGAVAPLLTGCLVFFMFSGTT